MSNPFGHPTHIDDIEGTVTQTRVLDGKKYAVKVKLSDYTKTVIDAVIPPAQPLFGPETDEKPLIVSHKEIESERLALKFEVAFDKGSEAR